MNATLSNHPIKELGNDEYKNALMDSLKKGNRQSVTFIQDGGEKKHYIEANPQFKTINIYDSNMLGLGNRQSKGEKQAEGESRSAKKETKKESQSNDDSPDMPQASKKKRKKQSIS
jgi:hypothetical protein